MRPLSTISGRVADKFMSELHHRDGYRPAASSQDGFDTPDRIRTHVDCPKCFMSVCTKCHSITHPGKCPDKDLDPGLEKQLKEWKIKRCPKCRTGVRGADCFYIECRCGARFCWGCLQPFSECKGQCNNQLPDTGPVDPNDFEEDVLDGNAGFRGGGGGGGLQNGREYAAAKA